MSVNIEGLSSKELAELISRANQRKKVLAKRKPAAQVKAAMLAKSEMEKIAAEVGLARGAQHLAHEGLVERIDVEGDRRAYRVRLTAKGRKLEEFLIK